MLMNDKIIGALSGMVLTVTILSVLGMVTAHGNNIIENNDNGFDHIGMHNSMMRFGDEDGEFHCSMMKDSKDYEEMHEMMESHMGLSLDEMDQDGDGLCDICGMQVEDCANMRNHHRDKEWR
jgi:hypothetical protein